MMKRLFDIFFSLLGLLCLFPLFLFIALWIVCDSGGDVFYTQIRVGKGGRDFRLFKFKSMRKGADQQGLLTVGGRDPRITRSGYFLRKYKLDELPQLLNVLIGDMSLVGPRPEVRKYVDLYTAEQRQVLELRPGITDYASITYSNENELLSRSADPERFYIEEIMPAKLRLNLVYLREKGIGKDLKIIFSTLVKIVA